MRFSDSPRRSFIEYLLPLVVLTILLSYSYARFFLVSYVGFQYVGASGEVSEIYLEQTTTPKLKVGDILVAVDGVGWDVLHESYDPNPLAVGLEAGDHVLLEVRGSEGLKTIDWVAQGFNLPEFWTRLINTWPLGYAFWFAGTAVLLFVRPKDERWALLVAFNYITAIWFTGGGLSSWAVLYSSIVFRAGIWLSLPVYIHFHWNFPNKLRPLPSAFWIFLYATGIVFLIAQWFGWIEREAYFYAFLLAVGVSVLILLFRFLFRSQDRREVGLLLFASAVAFAPAMTVALSSGNTSLNPALPGLLFSLLALPGAYFYVVYRRQLGGLELRANRLISIYLFAVLLITIALAIIATLSAGIQDLQAVGAAVVLTSFLTTLITGLGFPPFQRFVEQRLLHIPQTEDRLLTDFVGQISTSISRQNLVDLLKGRVLPSLLIRQSALFSFQDESTAAEVVYVHGVEPSQVPPLAALKRLLGSPEGLPSEGHADSDWVRVALPLRIGGSVCGLWLLGRKDPDDIYHQNERVLLASLAHQMAIALTNISQAQNLLTLHRFDIERQEAERIHLARELHDDVLPRINALSAPDPEANSVLDGLIERIRRLMAGLRPPLLDHGLYLALEQLVEDLKVKYGGAAQLEFGVKSNLIRFDPAVEQHLFRIIQQACENALFHGSPQNLSIRGEIREQGVDLKVEDNGIGFRLDGAGLASLLKARHFGLAGMSERAAMIGAKLAIDSTPGKGTKVHLSWEPTQN